LFYITLRAILDTRFTVFLITKFCYLALRNVDMDNSFERSDTFYVWRLGSVMLVYSGRETYRWGMFPRLYFDGVIMTAKSLGRKRSKAVCIDALVKLVLPRLLKLHMSCFCLAIFMSILSEFFLKACSLKQ